MTPRLLIIGAGGFGRAVAEAALESGAAVPVGYLDDRWPALDSIDGLPVFGNCAALAGWRDLADAATVAVGDNEAREQLHLAAGRAGLPLHSVIHPRAHVAASARLGRGVTVMAGAVIGANAKIGDGALLNYGCVIDHDCSIAGYVRLGVRSCVGGGALIGHGARLDAGATVAAAARIADFEHVREPGSNRQDPP